MVAVGGHPDELKGEIAKAYVVLKPGAPRRRRGHLRALPRASLPLTKSARYPVRRRPAEDLDRQDHAAGTAENGCVTATPSARASPGSARSAHGFAAAFSSRGFSAPITRSVSEVQPGGAGTVGPLPGPPPTMWTIL